MPIKFELIEPITGFDNKCAAALADIRNNYPNYMAEYAAAMGLMAQSAITPPASGTVSPPGTSVAGGTVPPPGTTPAPSAADQITATYFPSDPALALFPSPENSQILALATEISGRPYLKDKEGAIHQIKIGSDGRPQYFKNGTEVTVTAPEAVGQCLVRQGGVYMQLSSGIWKFVQPNGTMYNAGSLPVALVTTPAGGGAGATQTVPLPPMPAMPAPSTIAPGSSGNIINCGSGTALPTLTAGLNAARPGDTVKLAPGVYKETPHAITVPVLLDLGGATLDGDGLTATLAYGKAMLVPTTDCIIQNGTIINVAMDQTVGQLTSAIRPDAGCGYLTIKNVVAHNNQCAVGHGGFPIVIDIENSDISGNGLKVNTGSLTHNLYVGSDCRKLTLTNVISLDPTEAHAIKFRGHELVVNNGHFRSPNGSCIDVPDGSTAPVTITGATLEKAAGSGDHKVVGYGEESQTQGMAGMIVNGSTMALNCDNPLLNGMGGTIAFDAKTVWQGNKPTLTGGWTATGLPT